MKKKKIPRIKMKKY